MKVRRSIAASCAASAFVLIVATASQAAVYFPFSGTARNDGGIVAGAGFTIVNFPHSATALGFIDVGDDGLSDTYEVGLWRESDMQLLASTTVGPGDTLVGGYRYASITPITLPTGNYVVAALLPEDPAADDWLDQAGIALGVGFVGASTGRYLASPTLAFPTQTDTGNNYAVANVQTTQLVPEPAALGLLVAAAFLRRRR